MIMRKPILFYALLLLPLSAAWTQGQKAEWGLLFRGGNYTLPREGPLSEYYVSARFTQVPGYSSAGGFYGKLYLTHWLGLSTALMYQFSEFRTEEYLWQDIDTEPFRYDWNNALNFTAQHLYAPLCIHLRKSPSAKMSAHVGYAALYDAQTWSYYKFSGYGLTQNSTIPEVWENSGNARWQGLLIAGMERRLGERYSAGIQVLFNPKQEDSLPNSLLPTGTYPVSMRSLSLTLSHRL